MYECDSAMSQHRYGLDHQQEPIYSQEHYLDGMGVNVVLLQLVEGEIAQQNQPGDVDEEEHKEG